MNSIVRNFSSSDKIIGTTALTKYYCQYRKDVALLRMINFTQTSTKQVKNHSVKNRSSRKVQHENKSDR